MAYNYEYPYTDSERMNTDWMLHEIKNQREQNEGLEQKVQEELNRQNQKLEEQDSDITGIGDKVDNFITNLDFPGEVDKAINGLVSDGTIENILEKIGDKWNIVNVLDIGFDNTGTNDNSNIFYSYIQTHQTPTVYYFPAGIYLLNSTITPPAHTKIIGQGGQTILKKLTGSTFFSFANSDTELCYMHFDYQGDTYNHIGQAISIYLSGETLLNTRFHHLSLSGGVLLRVEGNGIINNLLLSDIISPNSAVLFSGVTLYTVTLYNLNLTYIELNSPSSNCCLSNFFVNFLSASGLYKIENGLILVPENSVYYTLFKPVQAVYVTNAVLRNVNIDNIDSQYKVKIGVYASNIRMYSVRIRSFETDITDTSGTSFYQNCTSGTSIIRGFGINNNIGSNTGILANAFCPTEITNKVTIRYLSGYTKPSNVNNRILLCGSLLWLELGFYRGDGIIARNFMNININIERSWNYPCFAISEQVDAPQPYIFYMDNSNNLILSSRGVQISTHYTTVYINTFVPLAPGQILSITDTADATGISADGGKLPGQPHITTEISQGLEGSGLQNPLEHGTHIHNLITVAPQINID